MSRSFDFAQEDKARYTKFMEEVPYKEKLSFQTKEAAEGAAVYARHRHGTKLKVYRCKYCDLWHLASL